MSLTSLQNKRVLLTGGTTGIGRATLNTLAEAGANLLTFGRHMPELEEALAPLAQRGLAVSGLVADVSRREDVQTVIQRSDETLGGLDILINNAAVQASAAQEMAEDDWRYAVETNLVGYMALVAPAIERMKANGGGHIVFVGSISAELQSPHSSVYTATKAAIAGYAKTLRKEVAAQNIRVTLVEPGLVGADLQGMPVEEQREKLAKEEMIYAEDIADAVHYVLTRPRRVDVSRIQIEPIQQNAA